MGWRRVSLRLSLAVVWVGLLQRSAGSWLLTAAGAGIGLIGLTGKRGGGRGDLKPASWRRIFGS